MGGSGKAGGVRSNGAVVPGGRSLSLAQREEIAARDGSRGRLFGLIAAGLRGRAAVDS